MSDKRVKRERFLPYAYDRLGLRCQLQQVEVDGQIAQEEIDHDTHLVDLRGAWSVARLQFVVTFDSELLSHVLPETEHASRPVAVLLVVRCKATHLRDGVLSRPNERNEAILSVELRHDRLARHAEVFPFLVRADDCAASSPGYASTRGSRLAGARPWTMRVDLERTPAGHHLMVQYKHFSQDPAIPAGERKAMWRLDAALDTPTLWLNSDHASIAELLDHGGARGRRPYLRDVMYDRIVASVWPRLFLMAAKSVHEIGEATYGWEQSVLDLLLPELYPHVLTMSGRLDRLRQELDDLPDLLGRLDAVLQVRDESVRHLERLVEAL